MIKKSDKILIKRVEKYSTKRVIADFLYKQVYQLSRMNPCDALHHGKRAANKGGRSV